MNGRQAKAIRRDARARCDSTITTMLVRAYKRQAKLLIDKDGQPVNDPQGKPIVRVPEHFVSTAFWPMPSYRRMRKIIKRGGRITGRRYDASEVAHG